MNSPNKTIIWFRRDLRIEDNPALAAAVKDGSVLPVFIWCPSEEGEFYPGRASRWWLKQSLTQLNQSLKSLGCPLVTMRTESTLPALLQCIDAIGATRVVYNNLYDPVSLVRDHKIKTQLMALGVSVQSFNADLLYEPWEVSDENGHAFTNFSAYWEKCKDLPIDSVTSLPPWKLVAATGVDVIHRCSIEDLGLENESEKSSNALLSRGWSPGWSNANIMLDEFVERHLAEYAKNRRKLEGTTTSLLSPYLHFGEISVKKIYRTVRTKQIQWAKDDMSEAEESVDLFLRSIGLREYSRYLCFNFPFTHERSLLGNFRHYPWQSDEGQFKSWRQGRTGYPLVDAGMRELWATGWIHNKTRVIVASFFVKFLLLPWTWGMKYFWDTLLDADLESDILGWQYVSGSLPDGHELNRLDSPEVQGHNFDPDGEYVRSWIPELVRMPNEWIHHPWNAPKSVLVAAGVDLGVNYPKPIVDINTARERLDDAVSLMWKLDRTSRVAKFGGTDEVVADNLMEINTLEIPVVIVKKEASCTSSSFDQRVPSYYNVKNNSRNITPRDVDGQRPIQANLNNQVETSKMNEDTLSTAESSSGRKRSISDSLYAVPNPKFSSAEENSLKEHDSYASVGSFVRKWQEADKLGADKEEEDIDVQSCIDGDRPSKRSS
ncbi:cryptochrome-1-like [Typha angustifolia]|uniref:cryptochrome-1-like n=1 Tax=Typha angustifolia TaxID=59011 RepID=UPI003C2BFAC4